MKKSVLFLCTHNSARSQIAEGLLRHYHGDRYESYSAGSEQTFVKPLAIESMKSLGIDISSQTSKLADEFLGKEIDYVITVCDNALEACPWIPAKIENMHKKFVDPSNAEGTEEEKLQAFVDTCHEIKSWIDEKFGA